MASAAEPEAGSGGGEARSDEIAARVRSPGRAIVEVDSEQVVTVHQHESVSQQPEPVSGGTPVFTFRSPTAIPVGHTVTATATDDAGNVSAFSGPRVVAAA
jgi:hypothetical protein